MENQFGEFTEPNLQTYYFCSSRLERARGFTKLMVLVLMTRKHPNLLTSIENYANILDTVNSKGWSALMLACSNIEHSTIETVKSLVSAGCNLDLQAGGYSALMHVCDNYPSLRNLELARILISNGCNLELKNNFGSNALMLACVNASIYIGDNAVMIRTLIETGSNVDSQNDRGYTPLMLVCRYHYVDTKSVKLLINAGANIHLQDKCGHTALMYLIKTGNFDNKVNILCKLIKLSKISLTCKTDEGDTAYDFYKNSGSNVLDEHHLKILRSEISISQVKSARNIFSDNLLQM